MAALGSFKFRCETGLGQPAAFSCCSGRSESAIGGAAPTTSSMGKPNNRRLRMDEDIDE